MKSMILAAAAVATSPVLAGGMIANNEVQFDVNSITVQSLDSMGNAVAFGGESHTGSLSLGLDANSGLAIFVDGSGFSSLRRGGPDGVFSMSATIELVNGQVMGGSITIAIDGGADSYTAEIRKNSGDVQVEANIGGDSFAIDGLTYQGFFSDNEFGGIDVSEFVARSPLTGNFLNFDFAPDATGFTSLADLDVFTAIPLPTSGALAGAGLAGLAVARRRR